MTPDSIWLIYRKTKDIQFNKIVDFCESKEEAEAMQAHYSRYGHDYYYFYGQVKKGLRYIQKL